MTRTVRLATGALTELDEAARWYDSRRRGLGHEFLEAVEEALASLRDWPSIGTPVETGGHRFRRVRVGGFPYHLPYRMTDDEVQVLAIAHDRRRPGYWAPRSTET